MSTEKINLNLTRKWRSKSFEQIIGQELSVRMLKNSLYLNQFFPVYLFSGQRGCGKTSTARVFAAAVNCAHLSEFQKDPRSFSVPCLECASCKSMLCGNHPDFIEIDAASHTGVDNVRQIIESSSFMPLMGSKKIYLIDEAHMLSKAAFNAFLKILEEPPSCVIFILATTNPQKIIATVRSRCFQLFFRSIAHEKLVNHLKNVCKKESITCDDNGLELIARESQGSVRDSLNILEQVRFSSQSVTSLAVQNVLGHIDDEKIVKLFDIMLTRGSKDIIMFLQDITYEVFSATYLWKKLIELLRASIWIKHGVSPAWCSQHSNKIGRLVSKISWQRLNDIMQLFYKNEGIFTKTTEKHSLLEMILMQIAQKNKNISNKSGGASSAPQQVISVEIQDDDQEYEEEIEEQEYDQEIEEDIEGVKAHTSHNVKKLGSSSNWDRFLIALDKLNDPLLSSIFKNGTFIKFDVVTGNIEVAFLKKFTFFKDSLQDAEKLWLPLLKNIYAQDVTFIPLFTGEGSPEIKKKIIRTEIKLPHNNINNNINNKISNKRYGRGKSRISSTSGAINFGALIDVSDVVMWKKANTLLKYFSGTVREIREVKEN